MSTVSLGVWRSRCVILIVVPYAFVREVLLSRYQRYRLARIAIIEASSHIGAHANDFVGVVLALVEHALGLVSGIFHLSVDDAVTGAHLIDLLLSISLHHLFLHLRW